MDKSKVLNASKKYEDLVNMYYENNGKKLYTMVDMILFGLNFDVVKSDFYSLGNMVFLDALCRYDGIQDFNGFLFCCLQNKFKSEMTGRTRGKRCIKVEVKEKDANGNVVTKKEILHDVSIDAPAKEDGSLTIGDMIAHQTTVEKEVFEERESGYSEKMCKYLSRLSDLQREVLELISVGFTPNEILEELHINRKTYEDCYNAIHSYRNTSVLL